MADANDALEYIGDGKGTSALGINRMQTRSVRSWFWPGPITAQDLQNIMQQILGTTLYDLNPNPPGRLNRTLPYADPLLPWTYAENIQGVRGVGGMGISVEPAQLTTNSATFPFWTLYPNYEFIVDCATRPGGDAISPDESIVAGGVAWYDIGNSLHNVTYYPEWLRFCAWRTDPVDDYATAPRGSAYFKTSDGSFPDGTQFPQSPRMYLPNEYLRLCWYDVPARYILSSNSYLNKFRGMVNQLDWNGPQGPDLQNPRSPSNLMGNTGIYPMGSLVYLGYKPTFKSPVLPITSNVFGTFISYDKLVDLELVFLHTTRVATKAPDLSATNKNFVANGWNMLPCVATRQFSFAYMTDLAMNDYPFFYSFPLQLLFTDPDAPGAYQGNG